MAESPAFDCVADLLERRTSLTRLEARGTVRLALKQAGLLAHEVTPAQMQIVAARLLPRELETRGVEDDVMALIGSALARLPVAPAARAAPEAVFQRLGGG